MENSRVDLLTSITAIPLEDDSSGNGVVHYEGTKCLIQVNKFDLLKRQIGCMGS